MKITKELTGKSVWLVPTGNNVERGKSDYAKRVNRGFSYNVVKVNRVNILVSRVNDDGSVANPVAIQRCQYSESHYESGLNAGYVAYESEQHYLKTLEKKELATSVANAVRNDISILMSLEDQDLEAIAIMLNIKQ